MPTKLPQFPTYSFSLERSIDITYQPAVEVGLSTPENLPTSEPATPQISITLTSSDFPTISPSPTSVSYIFTLIAVGKAGSTAGSLVWKILKNGSSVSNGSFSVSANYFYRVQAFFLGVQSGDTLALKLWSGVSGFNYDYYAWIIYPTRINYEDLLLVPSWKSYSGFVRIPTLTSSLAPGGVSEAGIIPQHLDLNLPAITSNFEIPVVSFKEVYGLFRVNNGDINTPNTAVGDTNAARTGLTYLRNLLPSQIVIKTYR